MMTVKQLSDRPLRCFQIVKRAYHANDAFFEILFHDQYTFMAKRSLLNSSGKTFKPIIYDRQFFPSSIEKILRLCALTFSSRRADTVVKKTYKSPSK